MRLVRPLAIAACTAALFGVLLWAVALAQTGDATPAPTPVPAETEPSAYLTLDMKAGFALDPFLVSLNGGGEVDASTFNTSCVGYINDKPVLTARWTGTVDQLPRLLLQRQRLDAGHQAAGRHLSLCRRPGG